MKNIVFLAMFASLGLFAQDKYLTKNGTINFEASVPAFEEVAAKNNSVTAIFNPDNGEIASLVLVKAFRFKNALMEEHFNENYAESDQYPKASFKGTVVGFSFEKINGKQQYYINGELTFHGITKPIKQIPVMMEKVNGNILLTGKFSVLASEFNIKIPKIVKSKVSDEVEVDFNFELQKSKP